MTEQMLCDPNCEICQGIGYYRMELAMDHPKFGKLFPCPGWHEGIRHYNLERVGVQETDLSRSWEDFKLIGNLEAVLDRVRTVLERGYGVIYLWGEFGTGKTSILKTAISWWIQERTGLCSYVTMSDLIENIRESYDQEHPTTEKQERVKYYSDLDLLCIDEVDRVRSTEFMEEVKFSILDRRYQQSIYQVGVTILTANVGPQMLDDYLRSRIQDQRHEILQVLAEDARAYQMWENKYDDNPLNGEVSSG